MKRPKGKGSKMIDRDRLVTPNLSEEERLLIERYCRRYKHPYGRGLLMAATREMRRDFGMPEEDEPPVGGAIV